MAEEQDYKKIFSKKLSDVKPGENVVSRKLASFWLDQIDDCESFNNKWVLKANQIVKRYRDDRSKAEREGQRRMNLLWTNIKIMMPALFSKCPTPIIDRKFLDRDPTGRLSSMILERGVKNEMEFNTFFYSVKQAVLDYLLPGRGQVWCRYVPEIGQATSVNTDYAAIEDGMDEIAEQEDITLLPENEEQEQLEESDLQVVSEKVMVDYLDWHDYFMMPAKARVWEEVQAVGKRVYFSKHECIERFGEEIGSKMLPDEVANTANAYKQSNYSGRTALQDQNDRDIIVIEIWNKVDRRVYWVSTGYDFLCDVQDDPLKLTEFFPCPKPLSATLTNDTLIPVPDFTEWQDQAIQIDELTQRIALLTKACKVAGTYDSANQGLRRLLQESCENELIPVDSWAAHADKGGVKGSISFLPIEEIIQVIDTLSKVRQAVKIDLDEVTGLSDILRGTTDSRETLGGLRLKNNNAGTRLSDRQNEVAAFARDTIKIVAEIMSKHFSDQTLIESSGILYEDELQPEAVIEEAKSELIQKIPQLMKTLKGVMGMQGPPAPQLGAPPPQIAPPAPQMQQAPGPMPNNVMPFPIQNGNIVPAPPPPASVQQVPQMPGPDDIMELIEEQASRLDPTVIIEEKISKAIALLRQDVTRMYRIDIETDSTIFADAMQERQDANEFITSITKFLATAVQLSEGLPEGMPLFGKILQFGVRKFRTGRDLESAINSFVSKMDKKAKEMENAPPPPSPEIMKAQAEIEKIKISGEMAAKNDERQYALEQQRIKHESDVQAANDTRDMQRQNAEDVRQAQLSKLDQQRAERNHQLEMEKMDRQTIFEREEHNMKMQELEFKHKEAMKPKPKAAAK